MKRLGEESRLGKASLLWVGRGDGELEVSSGRRNSTVCMPCAERVKEAYQEEIPLFTSAG